jgi:hypothetical protein
MKSESEPRAGGPALKADEDEDKFQNHPRLIGRILTMSRDADFSRTAASCTPSCPHSLNRAQRRKAASDVRRITLQVNRKPSPWSTDDMGWFAEHPRRSHRVRGRFPGEWFTDDDAAASISDLDLVAICQLEPGIRLRSPFTLPPSPYQERFLAAVETEGGAHAMCELVRGCKREVQCSEVQALIDRYSNAGGLT